MNEINTDILIIGAGLTGLTLAYYLRDQNIKVTIVEARARVGGRIHTLHDDTHPPLEMGATWFGKNHTALNQLLEELNVESFEQVLGARAIYEPASTSPPQLVYLPPNDAPSYRIKGGSDQLIMKLLDFIAGDKLFLNQTIQSIERKEQALVVQSNQLIFNAQYVISTLPPFLFHQQIQVKPSLPTPLIEIMNGTHTWMSDSIKIGLSYQHPFWRDAHTSGTIFSNVGPIPEMYDHANADDTKFALVGFLNGQYYSTSKADRKKLVLHQLEKYYGVVVHDYLQYDEVVWRNESFTHADYLQHVLPHQHGGHKIYQSSFLNNRLFIAGTETSPTHPGYMEGAVRSAQFVYDVLIDHKITPKGLN